MRGVCFDKICKLFIKYLREPKKTRAVAKNSAMLTTGKDSRNKRPASNHEVKISLGPDIMDPKSCKRAECATFVQIMPSAENPATNETPAAPEKINRCRRARRTSFSRCILSIILPNNPSGVSEDLRFRMGFRS